MTIHHTTLNIRGVAYVDRWFKPYPIFHTPSLSAPTLGNDRDVPRRIMIVK